MSSAASESIMPRRLAVRAESRYPLEPMLAARDDYDDAFFPAPALGRRFPAPPPLQRITKDQARRLYAIAMEAGYSPESLKRMLRFEGFRDADAVTSGRYEEICELAGSPGVAESFAGPEPVTDGRREERPHVAQATDEEVDRRLVLARVDDAWLERASGRILSFLASCDERSLWIASPSSPLDYVREQARELRMLQDELAFRLRLYRSLEPFVSQMLSVVRRE